GEPFFTTKEDGTGLGLMVTNQIVKEHLGELNIKSEPKKGTSVEVILPIIHW
ncbi:ATP-binding protein, partial [Neobacillus drentensis]|uniref:ATP-binding protein n=1 Tax=Neobacillus drentensis TaxID=220684 RepID=UPI002FFF349D